MLLGIWSAHAKAPAPAGGAGTPPTSWYNVRAFGARGDGVTSDSAAIQAAINAAERAGGGTVFFPCGTYLLRSADPRIVITHSNLQLVGSGGCSVIKLAGPTSFVGIFIHSAGAGRITPFARTAGQTSPTVDVVSARGFHVGQYVLLQDPENQKPAAGPSAAQLDQILAISGNTLTLATPVTYTYTASDPGAGVRPMSLLTGITIRDLSLDGSGITSKDGATIGIKSVGTLGEMVEDLRGQDLSGSVFQQTYAYESTVRNFVAVGSGSGGYGAFQAAVATACTYSDLLSLDAGLESIAQKQARPSGFGFLLSDVSASTATDLQSQGSFHGRGIKWATSNYNSGGEFIANGATDQDTGVSLVNAQWNTFDGIEAHGNVGEGLWFDEGSSHNVIENANVLGNALHSGHADLDFDLTSDDNVVRDAQYLTFFSHGQGNQVFPAPAGAQPASRTAPRGG